MQNISAGNNNWTLYILRQKSQISKEKKQVEPLCDQCIYEVFNQIMRRNCDRGLGTNPNVNHAMGCNGVFVSKKCVPMVLISLQYPTYLAINCLCQNSKTGDICRYP